MSETVNENEATEKPAKRRRLTAQERRDRKVAVAQREVDAARKSATRVLSRAEKAKATYLEAQAKADAVKEEIAVLEATLEWEKQRPVPGALALADEVAEQSDEDFGSEADEVAVPVFAEDSADEDEDDEFDNDSDDNDSDEDPL